MLLLLCNKSLNLWIKSHGTPLINIYVTLGKILDLCEPVFSAEDGHNTCLYFALFSGIKIPCEIVSL